MFRPRVIPLLLLKGRGLVKTVKFDKERYIGDPINAVRIFNDLKSDELIFVDITASREKRVISADLVKQICDEAYMPFAVGGGIKTVEEARILLGSGAEKIVLNTAVIENRKFIKDCSVEFGSQSIVVSVDIEKTFTGKHVIYSHSKKRKVDIDFALYLKEIEEMGAGELLINSVDNDGMMKGYDVELISKVSASVSIPVIACGGAGCLNDLADAYYKGNANAIAAGSLFVYHGARNAVLINYPDNKELLKVFNV